MTEAGKISRYSASAGSGKTYKLAGIYLDFLFKAPFNYRNILAVTFTNKAASEMKERILNNLFHLASGKDSPYLDQLLESYNTDIDKIRNRARAILDSILHDYSRFSVGTIDSFFQKVLRAFVKESGLHSGFNLVLDHSVILSEAVDEMLLSADNDANLLKWLIEYSRYEISQGNHWNLKRRIMELGEELFKEEYRLLYNEGRIVSDKKVLKEGMAKLVAFEKTFKSDIARLARDTISVIDNAGLTTDELAGKSRSFRALLDKAREGIPKDLGSATLKAWKEDKYYSGKAPSPSLQEAFNNGLKERLNEFCEYYEYGIKIYRSSRLVTANLFNLGILTDLSEQIREILNRSNNFLLSDAGDFLRQIIAKDQAPFIYEKVGARYRNFMIDEFQDTSLIQWKNFEPLIVDSLAEGESNLVVGDIKQAIYRWRNSDWRILNSLDKKFDPEQFDSQVLKENWRSKTNIIKFNNNVFAGLPALIENKQELEPGSISELYSESSQNDPGIHHGGYISIRELKKHDDRHQEQIVLEDIPSMIEEIQDRGYSGNDIGILVRKNKEGQAIINRIMEYASTVDSVKKQKYNYQVISADSLLLDNAPVINFIIACLVYINDSTDKLARAAMINFLAVIKGKCKDGSRPDYLLDNNETQLDKSPLGDDFDKYISGIRYLPVFEITDRLIDYFKLGEYESAIPFLNTIQDLILELSANETNDIAVFLDWWGNEGHKKSVASPDQDESMQLMTIHKSKGLQFKVVIIPFLSWTLEHGMRPNIWVYSDKKPFASLGAVPVMFKKEIANTHFKKYYDKEKLNMTIDKLNLLYVALTRAEECLYAYIPTNNRTNIGTLLKDAINDNSELPDFEDDPENENICNFSYGEKPEKSDSAISAKEIIEIPYNVTVDDSRLKIKIRAEHYIEKSKEDRPAVNYGLLMHEILSGIRYMSDLPKALNEAFNQGLIDTEEKKSLKERLRSGFANKLIASWFDDDNTVWLEHDILLPGGLIKRPDRVIKNENEVVVIDYKFGEEHSSHIKQVKEYIRVLKNIDSAIVKGYLWYVDKEIIREIN